MNASLCRLLGHRWVARAALIYDGCWTSDDVCSRCGCGSWWPQ